jgi:hypothetical protein
MPVITVTKELDVLEKYQALIKQSLSGESAYIRAKETIQDLVDSGAIDDATKAQVISNIVTSIVNNINSSSMSTAMSWASAEKDIELKKLELDKQLEILDQDDLLKQAQVTQVLNATRLAKVESRRMYGIPVFDAEGNIISLDETGKVVTDIALTAAQIVKSGSENTLLGQKVQESQAAVHKIVADTYKNYGNYSYSGLSSTGITTVTANHGAFKTLSDTQQDIAIEQAKGYTYNAWANALTGSASMLGTAIASELVDFTPGSTGSDLLITVLQTANNLKAASTTVDEAVPVL